MTFSEHLLSLRISKGLKQQEIAEKLGISLRVYQYYEHGDRTPPMETLIALADLYDITLPALVCPPLYAPRGPPPGTGVFFCTHKNQTKTRRGLPGPRFCPIGLYQG